MSENTMSSGSNNFSSGFSMADNKYASDAVYKASIVDAAAAAVAEVTGSAHYAGYGTSNDYDVKSPLHPNKVFIGGVPPAATEREVHDLFDREVGGVQHVQLGLHAGDPTRYHKGYGFVVFATKESYDKALQRGKFPIMEREIEVKPMDLGAKPKQRTGADSGEVPESQKLFIALKSGTTPHECVGLDEQELRDHFNHYGNVIKVVIVKDKVTQEAKGYGFIYFDSPKGPQISLQAGREHNITPTCRVECKNFQTPTAPRMPMAPTYGMGMPMANMMMMNPYASMYGGMYGSPNAAMTYGYGTGAASSGPYGAATGMSGRSGPYGSMQQSGTATDAVTGAGNGTYGVQQNVMGVAQGGSPQVTQGYPGRMQNPGMSATANVSQQQPNKDAYMQYGVMNTSANTTNQSGMEGQYGVSGYYGYPTMGPSR